MLCCQGDWMSWTLNVLFSFFCPRPLRAGISQESPILFTGRRWYNPTILCNCSLRNGHNLLHYVPRQFFSPSLLLIILNYGTTTCNRWTSLPVECFKSVFCCPCPSFYEKYCWQEVYPNHIFMKIYLVDEIQPKIFCLCFDFSFIWIECQKGFGN